MARKVHSSEHVWIMDPEVLEEAAGDHSALEGATGALGGAAGALGGAAGALGGAAGVVGGAIGAPEGVIGAPEGVIEDHSVPEMEPDFGAGGAAPGGAEFNPYMVN